MRSLLLLFAILFSLASPLTAGQAASPPIGLPGPAQAASSADSEIQDIYGPLASGQLPWLAISLGLTAVLVLLVVLFFFFRGKKKVPPPTFSAYDQALTELAALRPLMTAEHALLYMEKIADILRRYIAMQFAASVTSMTTEEFVRLLQTEPALADKLIEPCRSEIKFCLEQSDMAKFAHRPPSQAEMIEMDSAIRNVLEKTASLHLGQGGEQ
jgi:hypothetical protein